LLESSAWEFMSPKACFGVFVMCTKSTAEFLAKPKAKDYPDIFEYAKALEKHIEKLQDRIVALEVDLFNEV